MKTLTTLLLLLIVGTAQAGNQVAFKEVLSQNHSNFYGTGLLTISDFKGLNQIWAFVGNQPIPAVDFTKEFVLIYQDGEKPSGMFSTKIKSITDEGTRLLVEVEQISPGTRCVVTADIGHPVHAVTVDNSVRVGPSWWTTKPIEVKLVGTVRACGQ